MHNEFIDGALGTKEADAIVDNVVAKIQKYLKDCIYATRDTHTADYLATQEGKFLPVVHCLEGTKGWEINEKVAKALEGAVIVNKGTFGSAELADMLYFEAIGQDEVEIELIGLCTDICVVSNALLIKAFCPECEVIVDANACAGVTEGSHKAALVTMASCQCRIDNF